INNTNKAPLTFYTGNQEPIETNIKNPEAWYQINITIDLIASNVSLQIKSEEEDINENYTSSLEDINFDGSIEKLKLAGIRTSGNNHTWTTYLDNIKISHIPIDNDAIISVNEMPYHRVYVGETTKDV